MHQDICFGQAKILQENSTNREKIMVGLLSTRLIKFQVGTTVVTGQLVVLIHG